VALTAGFRWYIGRNKDDNKTLEKNVGNKTVVKKSTKSSRNIRARYEKYFEN